MNAKYECEHINFKSTKIQIRILFEKNSNTYMNTCTICNIGNYWPIFSADVYLEGWQTIANPAPSPLVEPDCFLSDDEYDNLNETSQCGVETLQRIDVHGK